MVGVFVGDASLIEKEETEIDEIIAGIEDAKTAKIRLLQELQKRYGYLREEHMKYAAKKIGTSYSDLFGIATFYAQFNLCPAGRHTVFVCEGTSCHVKGGKKILVKTSEILGIKVKETTEDGRFSLKVVRCLGCCGISPTIMVDSETFGRVKPTALESILAKFE